jgi:hypothetical protein
MLEEEVKVSHRIDVREDYDASGVLCIEARDGRNQRS